MKPISMCICEIPHLTLRLNRPYVFTEGPNCAKCKHLGDEARAAYGPDAGAEGAKDWKPKVVMELPDGDTRKITTFWSEWDKEDDDVLNLCISIEEPDPKPPGWQRAGDTLRDSPVSMWMINDEGRIYVVHRQTIAELLLKDGCLVQPLSPT